MQPVLFSISGVNIHSFGFFLIVGFLVGLFILRRLVVRHDLSFPFIKKHLLSLVLVAIIGARAFDAIFSGQYLPWSGGLSLNGAVIAGLIYFRCLANKGRQNFRAWLDVVIVAGLFALVPGYFGYALQGKGLGPVTNINWLSWSVIERIDYVNSGLPVVPLSLIMMLICLVLAVGLFYMLLHTRRRGLVFCVGWTAYYIAVWITEGMRSGEDVAYYMGEFNVAKLLALIFFSLGLAWLVFSVVKLEVAKKKKLRSG